MIRIFRPACPNPTALDNGNYRDRANKATLASASHGKCMYCEAFCLDNQFGDIEHFIPKSQRPELEYCWSNLGLSCTRCNNRKGSHFDPAAPLINPYEEDPNQHFYVYGALVLPREQSQRAQLTERVLMLNEPSVAEKRQSKLSELNDLVASLRATPEGPMKQQGIAILKTYAAADREFSMVVSAFIDEMDRQYFGAAAAEAH